MLPHIMNKNGTISIMIDGTMKPIDTAHKNFNEIKEAIITQNWDVIPDLVNLTKDVEEAIQTNETVAGSVSIVNGEVLYNGTVIHNTLTDRIISMAKEGFDIAHMVKFLENLMLNPSYRAVNELYGFLEAGNIPITENGTFLAYKKITSDYKDIYTGKIDNSIGQVISMPRNMVDEDSNRTCSSGLHVCSYDYLPSFGSTVDDRVVICEINPRDVVSIPTDYNNTKMRCCEYKVIGEVNDYQDSNVLASSTVLDTEDVNGGKVSGTVDHSPESAKRIGKMISAKLSDGEISTDDLCSILYDLNVEEGEVEYIKSKSDKGFFKKVGKAIAHLIKNGFINADELEIFISDDEEPERFDTCPECGAENSWELYEDQTCEQCGYENDKWITWYVNS